MRLTALAALLLLSFSAVWARYTDIPPNPNPSLADAADIYIDVFIDTPEPPPLANEQPSLPQLPRAQEEWITKFAKQCEAQGNRWIVGNSLIGQSPVSYCLTEALKKRRKICHANHKMWAWSMLDSKFECLEPQGYGDFDTAQRSKCKSLNGVWTNENTSDAYCATENIIKARTNCLEQHGRWVWNGFNYQMECFIPTVVRECKARGFHWVANFGRLERCMSDDDIAKLKQAETNCHESNGEWGPQGIMGSPGCVHHYPDKGKSCQSGGDCMSKDCEADRSTTEHGICAETDSHFGCHTWFISKEARKTLSPHTAVSLCAD